MPDVRLVDLELIKRFSLAVRREHADAEELLAVLDSDRQALLDLLDEGEARPARRKSTSSRSRSKSGAAKKTGGTSKGSGAKRSSSKGASKRSSSGSRTSRSRS